MNLMNMAASTRIENMTLSEAYNINPSWLGSPKMIAFYEALADIPYDNRVITPYMQPISITSDGYIISGGEFYGSIEDLVNNLEGLCEHFNTNICEAEMLMENTTDWRSESNAWSK